MLFYNASTLLNIYGNIVLEQNILKIHPKGMNGNLKKTIKTKIIDLLEILSVKKAIKSYLERVEQNK